MRTINNIYAGRSPATNNRVFRNFTKISVSKCVDIVIIYTITNFNIYNIQTNIF